MKSLFCIVALAFLCAGTSARAEDGKVIFDNQCAKCHGQDGKGGTPMGQKLHIKNLAADQAKLSDAEIEKAIKEGIQADGKMRMKAIKEVSSDADIKAVIKYVHTLK